MGPSAVGLYAIALIGVCSALPIQSVSAGDRNIVLLGALIFLSFGAVVAGCVCCRRRKKGFEEFRNESGSPESNKTEYPIFRALSPEAQRHDPVVAPPVSNSNENLIEDDDFDNNNGPISPADLENIENNNAVDYIQNQNEVGIIIEPSPYSMNRNLLNTSGSNVVEQEQFQFPQSSQSVPPLPELQGIDVTSTIPASPKGLQSEVLNDDKLEVVVIDKSDKDEILPSLEMGDINELEEVAVKMVQNAFSESSPKSLDTHAKIQFSDIDSAFEEHMIEESPICTNTEIIPCINLCVSHEGEDDAEDKNDVYTPDEVLSIKSGSSGNSGEISSIEEALRALDCAIAGENSINSGGDDDENMTDEDLECNDANFQNVIRQLLINDGVKCILNNDELNNVHFDDHFNKINNLDGVRSEAEILVDSILNESKKIAEERKKWNDETIEIDNYEIKDRVQVGPWEQENCNNKSESSTSLHANLSPCESIEDFLSFKPLEKTSTPCIQNKFTTYQTSTFVPSSRLDEASSRKKLLIGESSLFSPVENERPDKDFEALNETVESPNLANGTTTFPKTEPMDNNRTFAVDKTFEVGAGIETTFNVAAEKTFDVGAEKTCHVGSDKTFDMGADKTFDVQIIVTEAQSSNEEYTHPGDPCTSKQALERDSRFPSLSCDNDEMNSEDMTTITPVNTPIELRYSNELWNRITKGAESSANDENRENDDNGFASSGWFLHPQADNVHENETFDVDGEEEDEDEALRESSVEMLRKQLAELLPKPQGIAGPAEYSYDDEEDDIPPNRTFDEYRSPLDAAVVGLLEAEPTTESTVQNEMFINYKRFHLPTILEESEEETCKTYVMNETACLDSTSTGCVDTGEAIMGVTKALMASNDTLFNFEDTLGEREDVFSPRTPTRSDAQTNLSSKSGKSTEENSVSTLDSEKVDSNNSENVLEQDEHPGRRSPPKTIDLPTLSLETMMDSDVCSPEQQKTFSEGTNSSNTDRVSSDMSATVDHDTTFTTYTNDEKTCVTVIVRDDERISEISEPEWGSTASYVGYEMNSLTDIPSLDYNVNDDSTSSHSSNAASKDSNVETNNTLQMTNDGIIPRVDDNRQEDSGNSTHTSADDRTSNSDHSLGDESQQCDDKMSNTIVAVAHNDDLMNQSESNPSKNSTLPDMNLDDKENCRNFLQNEIEISSSQSLQQNCDTNNEITFDVDEDCSSSLDEEGDEGGDADFDFDSSKENKNPNIKEKLSLQQQQQHQLPPQLTLSPNSMDFDKQSISTISYQKVQTNSQDAVIVDKKSKLNSTADHLYDNVDMKKVVGSGVHENIFYKPERVTILPNKYQQTIINYNVNGAHNGEHCALVADEIIAHLSGEEDPWAEPLHSDIHFTGPCSEVVTSFTNEWDSDVDDSHSSEEFMYVRGTPTKEKLSDMLNDKTGDGSETNGDHDFFEYEGLHEADVWSTHEDKVRVADSAEDEISEGSSSEFEGEFVPSCWDSMATPARSALKSPDKSSSEEERKVQPNKKRQRVAFKKQRYHSVYEYPRENASLSPSYSEPYLYSRDKSMYFNGGDAKEEFSDGFTVSSSMRPFHGSQFNALCHTWPTDSDFSWSQIEDLGDITDDKKLATYSSTTSGKWPHNFDSIDLTDGDVKTENLEYYSNNRPDSGVGESAEMLSDRATLGEMCHTKSNLRLPILSQSDSMTDTKADSLKSNDSLLMDRLILPTPSCTGSMDSISSSSGSERQVSFSTFGKNKKTTPLTIEINDNNNKRSNCNTISIANNEQMKPALIMIENGPIEFPLGSDKIKQSDSTDEDSGIESIMKVNNL